MPGRRRKGSGGSRRRGMGRLERDINKVVRAPMRIVKRLLK